jgi:hypothetical protein
MKQTYTYETKGMQSLQTEFLEYRQSDENWVPLRWKSTQVTGTINGSRVGEFSLNGQIDPKEFELEFPPGTWVSETASPTTYIVKEDGKRRAITINELVSGNPYEAFLKTDTGELAPGPDTTNDEAARAEELAKHRMIQLHELKGRSLWTIPVVRQKDVEVRVEPVGTVNPREPIRVAIDETSRGQLLFGKGRDEAAARVEFAARVRRTIDDVDRICKLTDAQKQKLELAGRGDSVRLFKQVEELKPRVQKEYDENAVKKGDVDADITKLIRDTQPLRRMLDSESFDEDSLFARALNTTLTAEQRAKYEEKNKSKASVIPDE